MILEPKENALGMKEKVGRRRRGVPGVIHPDGMTAEKDSGSETPGGLAAQTDSGSETLERNGGGEEFRE